MMHIIAVLESDDLCDPPAYVLCKVFSVITSSVDVAVGSFLGAEVVVVILGATLGAKVVVLYELQVIAQLLIQVLLMKL